MVHQLLTSRHRSVGRPPQYTGNELEAENDAEKVSETESVELVESERDMDAVWLTVKDSLSVSDSDRLAVIDSLSLVVKDCDVVRVSEKVSVWLSLSVMDAVSISVLDSVSVKAE